MSNSDEKQPDLVPALAALAPEAPAAEAKPEEKPAAAAPDKAADLKKQLAKSEAEKAAMIKQLVEMSASIKELSKDLHSAEEHVKDLLAKGTDLGEDCVVLDGKKHKIVHKNRVKDLFEDIKRRIVDENDAGIIISHPL